MSSRQDGTTLRSRDSIYETERGTRIAIEKWRQSPWKGTGTMQEGEFGELPKLPRGNCLGTRSRSGWGWRESDENRKEHLALSGSSAVRLRIRRDSVVIVSATVPTCNVRRAGQMGVQGRKQKAGLARNGEYRNARHPQFTGNQRRECFVAV